MFSRKLLINVVAVSVLVLTMLGVDTQVAKAVPICDPIAYANTPYVQGGYVKGQGKGICGTGTNNYLKVVIQFKIKVKSTGAISYSTAQNFYCYSPCAWQTYNPGTVYNSGRAYQTLVSVYNIGSTENAYKVSGWLNP
jgi:hypothetical protein